MTDVKELAGWLGTEYETRPLTLYVSLGNTPLREWASG